MAINHEHFGTGLSEMTQHGQSHLTWLHKALVIFLGYSECKQNIRFHVNQTAKQGPPNQISDFLNFWEIAFDLEEEPAHV